MPGGRSRPMSRLKLMPLTELERPILISIRNKATRLPGKSFVDIGGRPAIEQLVTRMRRSTESDGVVICSSTHPDDAVFEPVARQLGVQCFRGAEEDKLDRYQEAARAYGSRFIVVVDGDDILCDPRQVDRIIAAWSDSVRGGEEADYVIVDHLPIGGTGFGVRVAALDRVMELKAESDTEVWGGYFTETGLFRCLLLEPDDPALARPDVRFTLDYPEDLEIFRAVFDACGGDPAGLEAAVAAYDADPRLVALADSAAGRWTSHLARSAPVRLRS